MAGKTNAIDVLDITDPRSPVLPGSLPNPFDAAPHDIAAAGATVALACGGLGVALFDATEPADMKTGAVCETGGWAEDLDHQADRAVLADGDEGLITRDIRSHTAPAMLSTCPLGGYARRAAVHGNLAFVLTNENGLSVFELMH